MANRETKKVTINRDRFIEVLKEKHTSIRELGRAYEEIDRTEKTIRNCLNHGKMPEELLDNIARYLKVHPDYLSGVEDEKANKIEDPFMKKMFLSHLKSENYPYLLKARSDIDYTRFFEEILTMNNITMEQFRTLPPVEHVLFHQEIVLAIYRVIAAHFSVDSLGNDTQEELRYCESVVNDFDPFSYLAELEGVGLPEPENIDKAQQGESEAERELREKYFPSEA